MAIPHAHPGEVISLQSDQAISEVAGTRTLFKTPHVEVIRLVLPQGKSIPQHQAPGEIVVQGLTGLTRFTAMDKTIEIGPGQMFYLSATEPHAVTAVEDCSFLLTILLAPRVKDPAGS